MMAEAQLYGILAEVNSLLSVCIKGLNVRDTISFSFHVLILASIRAATETASAMTIMAGTIAAM